MKTSKVNVFNVAKEMVRVNGLSSLTIRGLAKNAQVSIGTIYNLFGTKDQLIIDLIKDYWNESIAYIIQESNQAPGDFIDRIEVLYKSFIKVSGDFHKNWTKDIKGITMGNEPIYKLSLVYKEKINDHLKDILKSDSRVMGSLDSSFNLDRVAWLIQLVVFESEGQVDFYFLRIFLSKLFDIEKE